MDIGPMNAQTKENIFKGFSIEKYMSCFSDKTEFLRLSHYRIRQTIAQSTRLDD